MVFKKGGIKRTGPGSAGPTKSGRVRSGQGCAKEWLIYNPKCNLYETKQDKM